MSKLTLGVDPDSDKNGIAIFTDGKLGELTMLNTIEFYQFCAEFGADIDVVHMENVNGNKCSSFGWRDLPNARVKAKYSESVGKCKHAQQEIEKVCEHFNIKVVLHPPSSKWKDAQGKKEFERLTGWTGRSNADNRSAAWFAYIGSK